MADPAGHLDLHRFAVDDLDLENGLEHQIVELIEAAVGEESGGERVTTASAGETSSSLAAAGLKVTTRPSRSRLMKPSAMQVRILS